MLNKFHPSSFVLGIVSGLVALFLLAGILHFFRPSTGPAGRYPSRTHTTGQRRPSGPSQNLSRIAEKLGMTEADLRKELQNGKNLRDLAKERGVTLFPENGAPAGSGAKMPPPPADFEALSVPRQ